MGTSILCHSLALFLVLSSIHCHEHHNNDKDEKWTTFVTRIQSFSETESSESQTESFVATKTPITGKDDNTTSHTLMNGIGRILIKGFKPKIQDNSNGSDGQTGSAWLYIIIIGGIFIAISCCRCCCKCLCSSDDEKVDVVNSHAIPLPPPPQRVVQQPIFQNLHANMQHFSPPNPQWGQKHCQQPMPPPPPPYFPAGGVDNPNFYNPIVPYHVSPERY